MKKTIFLAVALLTFLGTVHASFPVKHIEEATENVAIENSNNTEIVAENSEVATESSEASGGDKDPTITLILALVSVIFLPFGLHNWYMGRKKQALWQTLLVVPGFILILPAIASWIWQVVDLIRIITGDLK